MPHQTVEPLWLGAHLSIAGGLHEALTRAKELRCTAVQIFTHGRGSWRVKPLEQEAIRLFRETHERLQPLKVIAHASYLLNLASPERDLRERSIRALIEQLERCEALGIPSVVLHPGAHMGAGDARGIRRIVGGLRRALKATRGMRAAVALENTAGQGTGIGSSFEHLARIDAGVGNRERIAFCFDTAHAFAAGHDLRNRTAFAALWDEYADLIGIDRLAIFHLNDSLKPLGSRVDRHTHIGQGEIGRRPFGWILADPRFRDIPKVIETPKEDDMDRRNLALLRRLAKAGAV